MASGVEAKARRRASRQQKAASGTAGPGAASFEMMQRTHVLLGDGSQVSAQQYINQHAVAGTVKVRVTGMGKQAVRTQESVDAEARLATFKPHKIIAYPFTGSGVEVGRIRQVRLKTNKSWAYSAGVPHGSGRTADIICDWFVLDAEASEKLWAKIAAAEDARLAALPHAQIVESVLETRPHRGGGDAEYLVKWKGYDDEAENTWEPVANLPAELVAAFKAGAFVSLAKRARVVEPAERGGVRAPDWVDDDDDELETVAEAAAKASAGAKAGGGTEGSAEAEAVAAARRLTVPKLREALLQRGLDATGLKAALVARLVEAGGV